MRCFLGIPVSGPLAHECVALSLGLPQASPRRNLHLTLAFLGECSPGSVKRLVPGVSALAARHAPFTIALTACEPFPEPEGPYLALTQTTQTALASLHDDIQQLLSAVDGFTAEERRFRPHVTLAKPGEPLQRRTGQWILDADQLWLYESDSRHGRPPSYHPLQRFALSGG
ncbi:MAG: RNA 2',3'-cyclic phosphodiesterase [Alcanivoracaceae bacterium]|nr:RNA 2',3'-cyclic phosphodiesterase [Alcanivoracaceae bacterium]MCG8439097.1 RNA 2',3'-cyclic phosphodiesterase [Pseudomonadales bacterium]MEE2869820.1 RNA 2',3'-cyclic phosphodiesterase [Pseudomonadota bacterium]|tara:strand:- start:2224 stop:2736 length:513 start_codon:yes stop_codon:yes gene_type:complete